MASAEKKREAARAEAPRVLDPRRQWPGLALLGAIALFATWTAGHLPASVSRVFIAVLAGIVVNNTIRPDRKIFGPGIRLATDRFLKLAVILLGAGVSFGEAAALGGRGLLAIWAVITAAFALSFLLGGKLKMPLRRKILFAVGLGICGNTAVAATAPLVEARDEDVFLAVGVVTLFGVAAVLAYPLLGRLLGMSETLFGAWAGTAICDTAQVVAAGFAYGEEAGRTATVIKLTRNVMMAPVILLISLFYRRKVRRTGPRAGAAGMFPPFIGGFLLLALLNSAGLLTAATSRAADQAAKFLVVLALSGIGLGVDLARLKKLGLKPFALGFSIAGGIATAGYFLNRLLFD